MGSWDGARFALYLLQAQGRISLSSEISANHLILQMRKLLREGR